MTLSIRGLKPAQLRALTKKARDEGTTPANYARTLIERALLADRTFDEILKPIREGFRKSGITENELDEIVTHARRDIYAKSKRAPRSRK